MGQSTGAPGPLLAGFDLALGEQGTLLDLPHSAERRLQVPGVDKPVARVVLDSVVPHLDRTFDYTVPAELAAGAQPGTRVTVRFGAQEMHGWVWSRTDTTTHLGKLSPLRRLVSDLAVLPETSRKLIEAVAARTAGTRADVVRLALPARHAATEQAVRDQPPTTPPTWQAPDNGGPWAAYGGGPEFIAALSQGHKPRAAWCALPPLPGRSEPWSTCLAVAAQACLASGRGVLIVVASTEQAEAVAGALRSELNGEDVVVLSSQHGPARRYRSFLKLLLGRARVAVGTRAAALAPVQNLGLAVIWDDGDNRLDERHAPYMHARTVLALRSSLEGAGLLLAGFSRSVEAQSLVERGWVQDLQAPRSLKRACTPRVSVPGAAELEAEGASGNARIPSLAHRALRGALAHGPVLIQVPRGGYVPVVACAACRRGAHCQHCSGPLSMSGAGRTVCRWCARMAANWVCPHCAGKGLRMVRVGSVRTGEELGRAFPNIPVVVSGARESHGVVASVDATPRLVVATPGAEPVARGGYRAVLLLDGAAISSRPELGAASEALRLWTNAAVLAAPGGLVMLLGGPDPVCAQALLRWDHAGFARRELGERHELHLPPAWRAARLDGAPRAVEKLLAYCVNAGFEVLGPVEVPNYHQQEPAPIGARALVRVPVEQGEELARKLRLWTRESSARREEPVRVELDPSVLW